MQTQEVQHAGSEELDRILEQLADQIVKRRLGDPPLRLIGVRTRGVPLAEELARRINLPEIQVGAVDITLYRDDLDQRRHWPVLRGTEVPFQVEGAEVVLVDDVLYTGRTVRAAINAICDLGRPACIRLAVLVDRQGRELPIHADYCGIALEVPAEDRIEVRLQPIDPVNGIVQVCHAQ